MLSLLLSTALSVPSLSADVPDGTDVVARVEVSALAPELELMWQDVEGLLDAWPPVKKLTETVLSAWGGILTSLAERTGADLKRRGVQLTLTIDLDAKGGPVYAVVVRGALGKGGAKPVDEKDQGVESFTIDGHPAYRLKGRDAAWVIVDGNILIFGTERGMQRQLRHFRRAKHTVNEPLQKLASQVRRASPVMLAYVLPDASRAAAAKLLPPIGSLISSVHSGTLEGKSRRLDMRLYADSDDDREALEHGVRALVALLRASTALLEGGAEAVLGLDLLGHRPPQIPVGLETTAIKGFIAEWLNGATFDSTLRRRRGHGVELTLELSNYRALVAAGGLLTFGFMPFFGGDGRAEAQVMLMALRQAQLAYKAETGEFLSCGPVPQPLPVARVAWPEESCFDLIGYRPPGKVRFQVASAVEEGELIMMASGDTDGDGVSEVWLLDEKSASVQAFMPPSGGDG